MSELINNLSKENFNEVLGNIQFVLVDFWAEWCEPCNLLEPVLEAVAEKYKDKVSINKLNTDDNAEIASDYKITGIPALIMFKDGKEIQRIVGYKPQEVIEEMIEKCLST